MHGTWFSFLVSICCKVSGNVRKIGKSQRSRQVTQNVIFCRLSRRKKKRKRIWHQGRWERKVGQTFGLLLPLSLSEYLSFFFFFIVVVSSLTLAMTHLTNRADRSRSWAEQWRSFQLSWERTTFCKARQNKGLIRA